MVIYSFLFCKLVIVFCFFKLIGITDHIKDQGFGVSLSTIAATSTLSFMISFHRLKARFVVMIVDFLPALKER